MKKPRPRNLRQSRFLQIIKNAVPVIDNTDVVIALNNFDYSLLTNEDGEYYAVKKNIGGYILNLTERQVTMLEDIIESYEPKTCGNCSELVSEDEDYCCGSCEREAVECEKFDNREKC